MLYSVHSIINQLREYVILEDAPMIPISALKGENIDELKNSVSQFISILNNLSGNNKTELALRSEEQSNSIESQCSFQYKSCGTLTNHWINRNDGQMFHVILRQGIVSK